MALKLNLGCRNEILDGFENIDLDEINLICEPERSDIIQMNAMEIDRHFKVGSVDEIVARHFFEHLSHEQVTILLYKIWSILKPAGILRITVPDFHGILQHYMAEHIEKNFANVDILHSRLFGIAEESLHKTVWTPEIGVYYLIREGFFDIDKIENSEQELELTFHCHKA